MVYSVEPLYGNTNNNNDNNNKNQNQNNVYYGRVGDYNTLLFIRDLKQLLAKQLFFKIIRIEFNCNYNCNLY
jgi:hypothetical protein